jgi:hypothetical protein
VQSGGGNIESAKLDWIITSDYNRYNNLYKSHSITKTVRTSTGCKTEAESQTCFTATTKSKRFKIGYCSKSKFQVNKLKWLLPISKEQSN